jgi:hypothetical protein
MAYVSVMAECVGCGQMFFFHPMKVPSITITGERRPICRDCVERVNPRRIANGLDPIEPLPGAYDAADETEVVYDDDDH